MRSRQVDWAAYDRCSVCFRSWACIPLGWGHNNQNYPKRKPHKGRRKLDGRDSSA